LFKYFVRKHFLTHSHHALAHHQKTLLKKYGKSIAERIKNLFQTNRKFDVGMNFVEKFLKIHFIIIKIT
jgi:hypothetical protein